MNKKFLTAASVVCTMAAVLFCGNLCGCSDEADTSSSSNSVIETTKVKETTAQVETTVLSETVASTIASDSKTEETTAEKNTEETKATDSDKNNEEKSENKDNNEKDTNKKEENKGNSGNSKVKEISLSENSFSMEIGSEKTIRIDYSPSDATDFAYSANTDSGCVTISCSGSNIYVYANYEGNCKLTVKTQSGITTSCNIQVKEAPDENYDNPYEEYANEVLRLVNEERSSRGLKELTSRNDITKIANRRAEEISENYTHECPDGTYIWNVLVESGVTGAASENIAFGQSSPKEVVEAWMASSQHRTSILNERYNKLGVGYCEKDGVTYWVQIFIQ